VTEFEEPTVRGRSVKLKSSYPQLQGLAGRATTLFAAGADATVIRTMGRWSSDIYRLYVRACFSQTIAWSRQAGLLGRLDRRAGRRAGVRRGGLLLSRVCFNLHYFFLLHSG
jgi:hypothetical protein